MNSQADESDALAAQATNTPNSPVLPGKTLDPLVVYKMQVQMAMAGGTIDDSEQKMLAELKDRLGVTDMQHTEAVEAYTVAVYTNDPEDTAKNTTEVRIRACTTFQGWQFFLFLFFLGLRWQKMARDDA